MNPRTKRIKGIHYDIYEQDELELYEKLKTRSGIRADGEFICWTIKTLIDRLERDDEILEDIRKEFSERVVGKE